MTKKISEYYNSSSRRKYYKKAFYTWELSEDDLEAIANSEVPKEYNYLNDLLDED